MAQLERRNCWDYTFKFFCWGILQPEMAQLEGRNCWYYILFFCWGILQPKMAQLEGRNCWDYLFNFFWWGGPAARDGTVGREELLGLPLQFFGGESCSQWWHSWKGGTAGTTSSNFFGAESCSQRWHSCQGGTAGIPPLNFPWKIKSQRWLNNIFSHQIPRLPLELFELFWELFWQDFRVVPLNFLNFLTPWTFWTF